MPTYKYSKKCPLFDNIVTIGRVVILVEGTVAERNNKDPKPEVRQPVKTAAIFGDARVVLIGKRVYETSKI